MADPFDNGGTPTIGTCMRKIDELRENLSGVEKDIRHEFGAEFKELGEKLSALHERIEERSASLKDQINKLDRENLTEGFSIKQQVAAIGWRVGAALSVAMFILHFIFKNLDVSDFIGGNQTNQHSGRKGGK